MKNQPVLPISHNPSSKGQNAFLTPSVPSSFSKYRLAAATLLAIWLVFKLCGSVSEPSSTTPSYPPNTRPANDYIELANFDSNGASADAPIHTNTKILVSEFVQTEPVSDNDADLASPDEYDYSKILADDLAMEDFVLDDDDVPEEEYVIPVVSLTADEAVQVNDFDVDIAIVDDGAVGEENDLDGVQSSAQEEGSEEANAVVVPELEVASGDDEYYEDYEEDLDIVHDDDDYEFLEHDDDENFATPQLKEIFDTVMAHSVVIYGKSDCPYTQRAKQIFAKYAITPHVVEVDTLANPAEIQDALTSLTLRATLPNIFVDGATIGGTDKLAELDARGDLNGVLRNAGLFAREKGESEVEL